MGGKPPTAAGTLAAGAIGGKKSGIVSSPAPPFSGTFAAAAASALVPTTPSIGAFTAGGSGSRGESRDKKRRDKRDGNRGGKSVGVGVATVHGSVAIEKKPVSTGTPVVLPAVPVAPVVVLRTPNTPAVDPRIFALPNDAPRSSFFFKKNFEFFFKKLLFIGYLFLVLHF